LVNFNGLITDIYYFVSQMGKTDEIPKAKPMMKQINQRWSKIIAKFKAKPLPNFKDKKQWETNLNTLTAEFNEFQKTLNKGKVPETKEAETILRDYFKAEELDTCLASGKPVLAEFGHMQCIPCRMMKPVLDSISAKYGPNLIVISPDVYQNLEAARKYGIRGIPTQIFFDKQGKEIARHLSYIDEDSLIKRLKELRMIK